MRDITRWFVALFAVGAACGLVPLACISSNGSPAVPGGSSSGGSVGGSSSVSGSSSSGSSSGAAVDGGTTLATGLQAPLGPWVVGSSLYWEENNDVIKTVPVAGGTPAVVFAAATSAGSFPSIRGSLTSDGTSLYFPLTVAPDGGGYTGMIMKCGLDGSNATILATLPEATLDAFPANVIYASGDVYVASAGAVDAVNTTTGAITSVVSDPAFQVLELMWADSTGLYYVGERAVGDGGITATKTFEFLASPLTGGSVNDFATVAAPYGYYGEVVAGGVAYVLTMQADGTQTTILSANPTTAADGGAATPFLSLPNWRTQAMAGDSNGLYLNQYATGDDAGPAGIYSVPLTASAPTLLVAAPEADQLAVDASHVYWIDTDGVLHATAR